jgi:hypothetical protein
MLAGWQAKHHKYPNGVVLLNIEHPMLQSLIEYWQSQYPPHYSEEIAKDVTTVYGQLAAAKIAHSEHLRGLLPPQQIEKELRSPGALTMALLGLVAEDQVISTRIGGKYKKRQVVPARRHSLPTRPR